MKKKSYIKKLKPYEQLVQRGNGYIELHTLTSFLNEHVTGRGPVVIAKSTGQPLVFVDLESYLEQKTKSILDDTFLNKLILTQEEVAALVNEFSNTYINAVDNSLASQVIQRMILWNNEQLSRRSSETE